MRILIFVLLVAGFGCGYIHEGRSLKGHLPMELYDSIMDKGVVKAYIFRCTDDWCHLKDTFTFPRKY